MADQGQTGEQGTRSPEEIQRDIEETREELADTVAAVAEKADVKTQAKRKVDETKAKAKAKVDEAKHSAEAKREQFASKAQETTPESAGAAGERVATLARENPVAVKIGVAFVAGVVVSRILSR
jgi:ElaB/YqjD/DUF883 family membrane-anchored ribosome-binding protein